MKKISILGILFLVMSTSIFVGCNTENIAQNNQEKNIESNENIVKNDESTSENSNLDKTEKESLPTSDMSGKLVNEYKTVDEINSDSQLAVKGTVISNEYIEYGGLTFTLSEFKINKVMKGDVNVGDAIKVLQNGGISEFKSNDENVKSFENSEEVEKNLKEKIGKKYEITIDGVKVLKKNDNAVLLLQKYEGPVASDAYVGTGDFQGRFIVDEKLKNVNPQSKHLKEDVKFDKLMNLK